jgi:hypothetical protein
LVFFLYSLMEHPTNDPPLCCSWSEKNSHAKIKLLAFMWWKLMRKNLKNVCGNPQKQNKHTHPQGGCVKYEFKKNVSFFPFYKFKNMIEWLTAVDFWLFRKKNYRHFYHVSMCYYANFTIFGQKSTFWPHRWFFPEKWCSTKLFLVNF